MVTPERALATVGYSVPEVQELLGSLLDDGDAYLVGSLAAGLGNTTSDVDIHLVGDEPVTGSAPTMFFLGETVVDVVLIDRNDIDRLVRALPSEWVPLAGGICALGPAPSRKAQSRLGRWCTAVALTEASPPLIPADAAAVAASARGAVDELAQALAIAHLIDARSEDVGVRGGGWRAAGCALLEVAVRARGSVFVGPKWLWSKAISIGLDEELLRRVGGVRTADTFRSAAAELGVPDLDPFELVQLRPSDSIEPVDVNSRPFILVNDQHLLDADLHVSGNLGDEVDRVGPDSVLTAIALGAATLLANDPALDEALR